VDDTDLYWVNIFGTPKERFFDVDDEFRLQVFWALTDKCLSMQFWYRIGSAHFFTESRFIVNIDVTVLEYA